MTDPAADAIAALEELAVRLGIAVADDHAATIGPPKARYYVNALRSALLSAQGQAGKPVGWRPISEARHGQPDIVLWFASTRLAVVPNAAEWWTWEQQPTLFCELPALVAIKGLET